MEFFLIGPVIATCDGRRIELGRRRERFLLALLLLDAGKPLPVDRLIELLWDGAAPRDPRSTLQVHVSRLRQLLAAADGGRSGITIVSSAAGYTIHADPDSVDVHQFTEQIAQARLIAEAAERAEVLRGALALWRGDPLSDVAPLSVRTRLCAHLAELRLTALESRVETDLELGRHELLIPELAGLTAEHPSRERLIAARMLALYRAGRQRDALAVYGQAAEFLREQFGLDSGAELRELRTAILRQDDELAAGRPFITSAGPSWLRPSQLPADVPSFAGRAAELATLSAAARQRSGQPVVVAITGMPGAGKTALAVHAAHQHAAQYPDGQLFIDLHGFTEGVEPVDPAAALDRMLRSLGVAAERIPESPEDRAALYRSQLAGRRMLIVLDNVASESQVAPLLPAAPGCLVVLTSRRSLVGLDDVAPLALDVLSAGEAARLFGALIADPGVLAAEPGAVEEVIELCGRLPLAVRLAASRLRHRGSWSVSYLAERLNDARDRLAELHAGERSVGAAIGLSCQGLTCQQREIFRVLGLIPCPDIAALAAAAAAGMDPDTAAAVLEQLLDAHLLEQSAPGRYHFHDLVRLFATREAKAVLPAAEQRDILDRVAGYYLSGASAAMHVLAPHQMPGPPAECPPGMTLPPLASDDQAWAWMDGERANLLAIALGSPGPLAPREPPDSPEPLAPPKQGLPAVARALSETLFPYFELRAQFSDALRLYEDAAHAARGRGDQDDEASALLRLGTFHQRAGHGRQARDCLRRALAIRQELGDTAAEGRVLTTLGRVCLAGGRHDEAFAHLARAIDVYRASGDRPGEERALRVFSNLLWERGQHQEAIAAALRAVELSQAAGFPTAEANARLSLGIYHSRLGHRQQAHDYFERAAQLLAQVGDLAGRSHALAGLGAVRAALGRGEQARADLRAALTLAHQTGDRNAEFEALHGLGEVLRLAGDLDGALSHDQAALELASDLDQPREQLRGLGAVARTLHALGRIAQAREYWERALDRFGAADVLEAAEIRARLAGLSSADGP
jgi:DNA-binding SARP family transcriptional activator/tetratricopeptide (TPR) repeat protein